MRQRKVILSIMILVLAVAGVALYFGKKSPAMEARQKVMTDTGTNTNQSSDKTRAQAQADETPFACDMSAISAQERPRHEEVTGQMRQAIQEVKELTDGYAFRFAASHQAILLLSEFIARERACCPFFTFELVVERNNGPLWLNLRGREGVKEFILAELNIKP